MSQEDLVKMLIAHEGNIPYAYKDSLGYWTIGVGFLIDKEKGGQLFPEEIEFILLNRIKKIKVDLNWHLTWFKDLDEVRQSVLIDMSFNLGVKGLLKFTNTLDLIKNKKYTEASKAMLDSLWAKQVKGRAVKLATMMREG